MGLATRLVPPEISSHEKVFYRSLIGTCLLGVWFGVTRPPLGRPQNWPGLACRGVFGGLSLLFFFYAIDTVGLAKATLYCYTYPVFAAVFSWIDLGEKPTALVWAALLCAVTGAVITVGNTSIELTATKGDIAGVLSGLLSGAAVTSIRRLTRTDRSAWIVLSFTLTSTLLAWPLMGAGKAEFETRTILPLLAVGISAIAAQVLLTSGLRHIPAVEGGILSLAAVPISAVLAIIFLKEPVGSRFWIGAVFILIAGIVVTYATGLNRKSRSGQGGPNGQSGVD
jgi:drug/metabolite transporter (DMT)-like permease